MKVHFKGNTLAKSRNFRSFLLTPIIGISKDTDENSLCFCFGFLCCTLILEFKTN